jgi:hypothetical protein
MPKIMARGLGAAVDLRGAGHGAGDADQLPQEAHAQSPHLPPRPSRSLVRSLARSLMVACALVAAMAASGRRFDHAQTQCWQENDNASKRQFGMARETALYAIRNKQVNRFWQR